MTTGTATVGYRFNPRAATLSMTTHKAEILDMLAIEDEELLLMLSA